MTGTPSGVGEFKIGDEFIGKILLNDDTLVQFNCTVI
jgi:2-keto-4-pentenoate hydratase/2-oxohepta-3-ene-1,7-dioic acid hydratase in catechol pathway